MKKKIYLMRILFILFMISFTMLFPEDRSGKIRIKRLTFSKNHKVLYASISGNGLNVVYTLEKISEEGSPKSIRLLGMETGKEVEIFSPGKTPSPKPYGKAVLMVGSKPPLLSGDGRTAVFLLTLGPPENKIDHLLAVANIESRDIQVLSFPHEALKGMDARSLDFQNSNWERISSFAINHDGSRIACALKGHLGPRRYGNCSGIMLVDLKENTMRTRLGPEFKNESWKPVSFPRNPLLGGGWSFALSGNGEKIVFGAQSSEEKTDYDLYILDWNTGMSKRITRFQDRWFSLADISFDGKQVVFCYNGEKNQGTGTYRINSDGSGLQLLGSSSLSRLELYGMAGDGSCIFYKNVYQGMMLRLDSNAEFVVLDEKMPGYAKGIIPMDFFTVPAFCTPKTVDLSGGKILLSGPPLGRQFSEIYVLYLPVLKTNLKNVIR